MSRQWKFQPKSEDVLQDILTSDARLRIPNVTISEPLTETEDESTSIEVAQKQLVANEKKQKSEKQVAASKHMTSILNMHKSNPIFEVNLDSSSDEEYTVAHEPKKCKRTACADCDQLRLKIAKLESKVKVLTELNVNLQASYFKCSKEKENIKLEKIEVPEPASPPASMVPDEDSLTTQELNMLDKKKKPSLFTKNLSVRYLERTP
ncbi:uncharacterized protein LOC117112052 [Anneissia japonica]|uniref:uncharacterized protein LOC117112052 n=1 Tax=Anneissia japonica TaxID=1529436 RepID=UPI0014256CF2|nr:uncharacterized protein LOC117112052 [Anneissia japonica]